MSSPTSNPCSKLPVGPMSIRSTALLILLLSPLRAEEPAPWPSSVRSQPAKVLPAEPPDGIAFAYESASFRLYSDDAIEPQRLTEFATVIESVPRLLQALPLPLWAPPKGDKPRIILCRDALHYQSRGGPLGSMGFYNGRQQRVLIRADIFLNPPTARPTRLLPKPNQELLVHELTHLGMHDLLWRTSPWFFEGIAEYLAAAHTGGGNYDFSNIATAIRDRIRLHLPPDAQHRINLPALQTVLTTTSRDWIEGSKHAEGHTAYRPYAASLLLIHYTLHGKERRAALETYLRNAAEYRDRRLPLPRLKVGPTSDIEQRLTDFWTPRGLPIQFESPTPSPTTP